MRIFLVAAAVLTLAGQAAAARQPPADICAAIVVADQDEKTMTEAAEAVGTALLDDKVAVWRQLRLRKVGNRVRGAWGECPAPSFDLRYLAFSPDGRFAWLDNRARPNRAEDGNFILAEKTQTGWRMVGSRERLTFADLRTPP